MTFSVNHQLTDSAILDCLVDSPGSFASIYRDVAARTGHVPSVDALMTLLRQMADSGLITCNLATSEKVSSLDDRIQLQLTNEYKSLVQRVSLSDLAFDDVGLCVDLTKSGRDAWGVWRAQFGA